MKMTISATNRLVRVISRTTASPGDVPGHELIQDISLVETKSADPDWDGANAVVHGQSDQIEGSGSHRGYATHSHADGSETHFSYEGNHTTTVHEEGAWETALEGTFQWTGGSGKFSNIKGGGTYGGRGTPEEVTESWDGEVEY